MRKSLSMAMMKRLPHEQQLAIAREHIAKLPNYAIAKHIDRDAARKEKVSYQRNLVIYEAMYEYAQTMGALNRGDPHRLRDHMKMRRIFHAVVQPIAGQDRQRVG